MHTNIKSINIALVPRGKKGIYYFRYFLNGKEIWKSSKTNNKNEAQFRALKLQQDLQDGFLEQKDICTDVFEAYVQALENSKLGEKHILSQVLRVKSFLDFAKPRKMGDISPALWSNFQGNMNQSPTTVAHYFAALRRFLKWAMKNPHIKSPYLRFYPLEGVTPPRIPVRAIKYLTESQAKQLMKHVRELKHRNMLLATSIALHTGARANEILNISWEDITKDTLTIRHSKTKIDRIIPFSGSLAKDLKPYRSTGKIFNLYSMPPKRTWHKVLKDLKLDITFHGLRHTYITMLLRKGVDILTVKELAGHTKIDTTMRYLHVDNDAKKKAGRKINL